MAANTNTTTNRITASMMYATKRVPVSARGPFRLGSGVKSVTGFLSSVERQSKQLAGPQQGDARGNRPSRNHECMASAHDEQSDRDHDGDDAGRVVRQCGVD